MSSTLSLRFGVFRSTDRDPFARFILWHDARAWADACTDDDSKNIYVVKQLVDVPPPGLGSMWTRCDTEEDIQ